MVKKIVKSEFRVEVYPRSPGNFGFARISGITRSDDEAMSLCEDIKSQIRRHVDDVESVNVTWDSNPVCGFCGSDWSEDTDVHNGGCCAEDGDVYDAYEASVPQS